MAEIQKGIEIEFVQELEPVDPGPGKELFAEDGFELLEVEASTPRLTASARYASTAWAIVTLGLALGRISCRRDGRCLGRGRTGSGWRSGLGYR